MNFTTFFTVLVIAAVVACVYHFVLRYRFLEGYDALAGKVIIGWLGGWIGSLIFGNRLWKIQDVYVLPAVLGAIAAIHMSVLIWKAVEKVAAIRARAAVEETQPRKFTAAA